MKTLDADTIMTRATPVAHQRAREIQPFSRDAAGRLGIKPQRAAVPDEEAGDRAAG